MEVDSALPGKGCALPAAPVSRANTLRQPSVGCCVSFAPLQQDEALESLADNVVVTTVSSAFILLVRTLPTVAFAPPWRVVACCCTFARLSGYVPRTVWRDWPQVIVLQYAYLGSRLQTFIREHEGMMHVVKRIFDDIKRAKQPGT